MKPEDLLLAPELSTEEVTEFLARFGFSDPAAADRNLQLMAEDVTTRLALARMLGKLLKVIRETPDPDGALNHFERLLGVVSHPVNFLGFLGDTAEALEAVLLICGCSSYASEILIRDPETFYWLLNELGAPWPKSLASYRKEARQAISPGWGDEDQLRALARFKRREMLRISARDLLRIIDVGGTTTELSRLAESVIDCVYEICRARLVSRHGIPQTSDGRGGMREARFTVLGMGKLGGEELNYSSDIDLIYCYDGEEGQTGSGEACSKAPLSNSPAKTISNREFFTKLARMITQALSESTVEGAFYRVDLRLRPEGSTGNVATSLTDYRNYYGSWGETFERLALIKARPVGGSRELGRTFCETFRPFTYRKFLDFASLEELQEIKNRINAKLDSTGKQGRHVKLGEGGIREVEFFVQALQLIYGGRHPHLQQAQTVQALEALHRARFLNAREHRGLREAYEFLRDLEHKLQMVFHFQTHELPEKEEDLYKCARRMGIAGSTDAETVDRFRQTYARHTALVHGMFEDLVAWRRGGAAGVEIREAALVLHPGLAEQEAHRDACRPGIFRPENRLPPDHPVAGCPLLRSCPLPDAQPAGQPDAETAERTAVQPRPRRRPVRIRKFRRRPGRPGFALRLAERVPGCSGPTPETALFQSISFGLPLQKARILRHPGPPRGVETAEDTRTLLGRVGLAAPGSRQRPG